MATTIKEYRAIEKAKAFLASHGYQTDNLWHIDDVKSKDRKSTRLNSSHMSESRMPSSA